MSERLSIADCKSRKRWLRQHRQDCRLHEKAEDCHSCRREKPGDDKEMMGRIESSSCSIIVLAIPQSNSKLCIPWTMLRSDEIFG